MQSLHVTTSKPSLVHVAAVFTVSVCLCSHVTVTLPAVTSIGTAFSSILDTSAVSCPFLPAIFNCVVPIAASSNILNVAVYTIPVFVIFDLPDAKA